jgi:hypothetical protein
MNILPLKQLFEPKPLTKVDVSRMDIANPFVIAMIKQKWQPEVKGNRVWLVKP